ncbi:MAG TPA: heme o synthase [Chloroflexota bacterium]|nr:heme o synthase [Chloroflexota bacterium]
MDYVRLTKPGSVGLLLLTALAGMTAVGSGLPSLSLVVATLAGGALAAGGSNALNCYLDRDLDRLMPRTANRPLPSGRLAPLKAAAFGILLCLLSFVLLAATVNLLAALLAMAGMIYYVVVYTLWLKRRSPWNVVVGGGAGGLPLLVGSAAATGEISPWALILGAVIFLWTPPHFWSLALLRRDEYGRAGLPMMPVVRGSLETRRQILLYSMFLVGLSLLVPVMGFTGSGPLFVAAILGTVMLMLALRLLRHESPRAARQLYRYSVLYLALLLSTLILDRAGGLPALLGTS